MPHSYILECYQLYRINRKLRAFIKSLVGLWKIIAQISLNCGIKLKDVLSTISSLRVFEYRFRSRATISQLLYIDDLKLYARNETSINMQR